MALRQSTGMRDAMLNNQGFAEVFANGSIEIYSGPQPASADSAATGTLLARVTKDAGAWTAGTATNGLNFGTASGGVISKNSDNWRHTGLADGTAGWFRLVGNAPDSGAASTSLPRLDGAIGASGELQLSNLNITSGVPGTVDVFSYALPASK